MAARGRLGLRNNTAIILIADHGWHLGEKGMWAKLTLFEPSTRVPLILSVPGMAKGRGCVLTVESLDVYPTLAGVCGPGVPRALEGKSLRPLLSDPAHAWDKPAYSFIRRGATGRRHGAHRALPLHRVGRRQGRRGTDDYNQDPTGSRNLSADPRRAATVRQMKDVLLAG